MPALAGAQGAEVVGHLALRRCLALSAFLLGKLLHRQNAVLPHQNPLRDVAHGGVFCKECGKIEHCQSQFITMKPEAFMLK